MKLLLIGVAFDSGHRDQRMGRGPGRLIDGGAVERLRQGGHDVEVAFAEPASRFTTEIGTAFELQRSVAAYVGRARAANAFPLILSGNCNTAAIGALAGLGASRPSLVWFDGHADFCTPETAEMGFLDGMGLAMATGRCWTRMTSIVPGFQPVPDELALLVGAHDIEAREGDDLRRSGIVHVPVERLRHGVDDPALAHALAHVRPRTDATYLHIDLDVLNREVIDGCDARGLASMEPSQATCIGGLLEAGGVVPVAVALAAHRWRSAHQAVGHLEGAAAVHHAWAPVKTGR